MVKTLQKQTIEKQDFLIFLRDLASGLNINLKHMIEDSIQTEEKKGKKNNYHKGKKKPIKKKDLIIQEQNKKRKLIDYKDDQGKIEYLFNELDEEDPFKSIKLLRTKEGKDEFKIKLLIHFWENKKKFMKFIIVLFFHLKEEDIKHDIIDKVELLLDDYDYQLFMMKEMGHMLPPLDYWNQKERKFDKWQLDVIHHVHQKESVILKAPTSSGKTFIAMSAGIFHKKVLYVCPAKPVVYQIGAHFVHMGYKVHFLVDNLSNYSYDSKTNIYIGTPQEIEDNIFMIGNNFDYVVFDEIHNLNKEDDGHIYENLTKLLDCNFLSLSATVQNIESLKEYFQKINPNKKIYSVEYNERFINQQRWLWNGTSLLKIHPMCAFDSYDETFMTSQISYTPNDCAILWEKIELIFDDIIEDIDNYSPDEFFSKKMITLNDCKEYELFLKNKLTTLNQKYPQEVQKVFNLFHQPKPHKNDIIQFIRKAKKEDMFPMLMFHTDESECSNIFNILYQSLEKQEIADYPFHYDILEKKQSFYEDFLKKREIYQSSLKVGKQSNPVHFIKEKMDQYDRKEKDNYISLMSEYYQSKIRDIQKKDGNHVKQEENLVKEMTQFLMNPDFCYQDIFQKHKEFIFTKSNKPMDADTIRNVRREIKKTLGIKIPYESCIFQMLKRGIGLYTKNMPDEYNWILQKLLSSKEIGIVISDNTLCLGIDLPVRSSCFLGMNNPNFTKDDYLQMSGRAGRRGLDTKGNIIFYGDIDYVSLMRSSLPVINGNQTPIYNTYKVHPLSEKLITNMFNPHREYIEIPSLTISDKNKKIVWVLREFKNCTSLIQELQTIEKKLFQLNEYDRAEYLLHKYEMMLDIKVVHTYKSKKITNHNEINILKKFMAVIMNLYNILNYQKYMITMDVMKDIFLSMNRMVYSFIL